MLSLAKRCLKTTSTRSITTLSKPTTISSYSPKQALTRAGAIYSTYSTISHFQSLSKVSQPIYCTPSSQFSTTTQVQAPVPLPIPQRDPSTFSYFTPIDEANEIVENMTFPSTIHGKEPYQIAPPTMPTKQFEWSDKVLNFTKYIWSEGFNHDERSQNPFVFSPFHAAHRGKLEIEVFHKFGTGHPVTPEESGDLTKIIPSDSKLASHQAFPHLGPNGEAPVISTIGICHAGPYAQGPPIRVHGGAIASIFDVVAYRCVEKSGRKTVTANLNVNYRTSIPICTEFITATTVRFLGERKALADFVMCDLDMKTVYAEGTGLFITPKEWGGKESFDYVGDMTEYLDQNNAEYHIPSSETSTRQ